MHEGEGAEEGGIERGGAAGRGAEEGGAVGQADSLMNKKPGVGWGAQSRTLRSRLELNVDT